MIGKRIASVFRAQGAVGVMRAAVRRMRQPRARCFAACRALVEGAEGLEIGGPSAIFSPYGLLPCYPLARRIDNCNFAAVTIFGNSERPPGQESTSGERPSAGGEFEFCKGRAPGRQFIAEGIDLHMIARDRYDVVLSSHMLEHTANPLRALAEWGRVLKPGGGLVLVLPHRDGTFDRRRPITTIEHLASDFENNVGEDDLTHLQEAIELHDVALDTGVRCAREFRERALQNAHVRSLHHHVFDSRLAAALVERAGFVLVAIEPLRPYHIVLLARKPDALSAHATAAAVDLDQALQRSPFPTDRRC